MKFKKGNVKFIILISVIILIVAIGLFVFISNRPLKEVSFNLVYEKRKSADNLIMEGYDANTYTIILPSGTTLLSDDSKLNRYFKFYDYENGTEIKDLTYDLDSCSFDNSKAGIYNIDIIGKYENKVGKTSIKVEIVDTVSGKCVIKTTNWKIELLGNSKYTEYSPDYKYNVQVKLYPTASANYNPYLLNTANYDGLFDGYIYLYYKEFDSMNKVIASDPSSQELDNALTLYYKQDKNSIKQKTYIQFKSVPKLEDEAYIDFYDKTADKHNIYLISGGK